MTEVTSTCATQCRRSDVLLAHVPLPKDEQTYLVWYHIFKFCLVLSCFIFFSSFNSSVSHPLSVVAMLSLERLNKCNIFLLGVLSRNALVDNLLPCAALSLAL